MQIVVVDLGVGNLRSVEQAIRHVAKNADVLVSSNASEIARADKLVLPGQGAIGSWLDSLQSLGLQSVIQTAIEQKPLFGICVGMQALFSYCEEDGGREGLSIFDGSVKHFSNFHQPALDQIERMKIPQMGWNQLRQTQPHPMWHGIEQNKHFYFLHSYCANMNSDATQDVVYGTADYGHEYVAAVAKDNVFAVQFHPEKSHDDGLQLLKNFCQWQV